MGVEKGNDYLEEIAKAESKSETGRDRIGVPGNVAPGVPDEVRRGNLVADSLKDTAADAKKIAERGARLNETEGGDPAGELKVLVKRQMEKALAKFTKLLAKQGKTASEQEAFESAKADVDLLDDFVKNPGKHSREEFDQRFSGK